MLNRNQDSDFPDLLSQVNRLRDLLTAAQEDDGAFPTAPGANAALHALLSQLSDTADHLYDALKASQDAASVPENQAEDGQV